jgi:tetratricopeptide (TPR) repeat protein
MLYESGEADASALAKAVAALEKAAALDPAREPEDLKAARDLVAAAKARADAAKAREGKPAAAPAATGTYRDYATAGDQAEQSGDPELAAADYRKAEAAATTDKGRSAGANLLGLFSLRERRPREAADHFRRATTLDPKNKVAWNNLGAARRRTYEGTGDPAALRDAAAAFAKAGELDAEFHAENREWAQREMKAAGVAPEAAVGEAAASAAAPASPGKAADGGAYGNPVR